MNFDIDESRRLTPLILLYIHFVKFVEKWFQSGGPGSL